MCVSIVALHITKKVVPDDYKSCFSMLVNYVTSMGLPHIIKKVILNHFFMFFNTHTHTVTYMVK